MPHQLPAVLAYLRRHFPNCDWVKLAQQDLSANTLARHIALAHDLTVKEASTVIEEAHMSAIGQARPRRQMARAA